MKKLLKILVIFILVGIVIIRTFFVDYMMIRGDSMKDFLKNGDVILIKKNYNEINRYDVVILKTDGVGIKGKVIKRVIGMPGETIQILNGYVYINGVKLEDDVVNIKMVFSGIAENEIVLDDDEYFVLGDNRNASEDSRNEWLGIVESNQVVGIYFFKISKKD